MAAAAPDIEAHPEVVGVLPSLGGGVPEGEPEAVLINPVGLKATLDKVVNPDTGITLAMVVDDNGENIMHSTGTTKSDAEVRAGLAFSVVQTHLNALKVEQGAAAAASADRDLLDVGQFKILLMQTKNGKLCVVPCHTLFIVLMAARGSDCEDGMIKNRAEALAAALEAPFKRIWTDPEDPPATPPPANGIVPQNGGAVPEAEPEAEPDNGMFVARTAPVPRWVPGYLEADPQAQADPLSSSNNHGLENDMDKLNVSDNKPEADTSLLDTSDEEPKPTIIDDINDYVAEPETNDSDAEVNRSDAKAKDSDAEANRSDSKANDSDAEANEATD